MVPKSRIHPGLYPLDTLEHRSRRDIEKMGRVEWRMGRETVALLEDVKNDKL